MNHYIQCEISIWLCFTQNVSHFSFFFSATNIVSMKALLLSVYDLNFNLDALC